MAGIHKLNSMAIMHSCVMFLICILLTHADESNSIRNYTINTNVDQNSTDITPISTDIDIISTDITPISTNIAPISTDIAPISTDIAPISTDIVQISTDISPISTDIAPISTDITPVENQTVQHNVTEECEKEVEKVKFLEEYTANITFLEEQFDRELYDTFNNLSTLLSEGSSTYDEFTIKLLGKYSADANNFMITCKYIQLYSVCSETLKKSLTSYVIPQWQEHLDFGIIILNNFRTYVNYSQGYLSKRKETVNQFIELYKTWRLRRKIEKELYQHVLNLSGDSALEEFMKVLKMERKMIETISDIIDCINKLEGIEANDSVYNHTIEFALTEKMDIEKWNSTHNNWKTALSRDELSYERKSISESLNFLRDKIHPAVLGILFIIGTLGNGVLILVFIFNKEMRSPPNFPIINLTIADIFTLAINGLLFIFKLNTAWTLGEEICVVYSFLEHFGITLSMYSVVLVSIQRFLAVTNCCKWDISKHFLPKKLTSYVPIVIIWIISAGISSLNILFGEENTALKDQVCSIQVSKKYVEVFLYSLVVFIGIVPLVTIAGMSTVTSYRMRNSIKNMPGEAEGLKKVVKARALSSRIILALTVVFIISHFPFFAILLCTSIYFLNPTEISVYTLYIFIYATVLAHAMKLLNPCFNPLALYLMSRKYRIYMNKYLTCGLASRFSKPIRSDTTECEDLSS